jgi:hypothetical protein
MIAPAAPYAKNVFVRALVLAENRESQPKAASKDRIVNLNLPTRQLLTTLLLPG